MNSNTQNKITYIEKDGILYPDLTLPKQTDYPIGKYGSLHLKYLKAHKKGRYTLLLTEGRLNEYLHNIDIQAKEEIEHLIAKLALSRGIDESLKESDQFRWVQEMNTAKHDAEEIVLLNMIYR